MRRMNVAALAALLAASAAAQAAGQDEQYISVGTSALTDFWIDKATVRKAGDIVTYSTVGSNRTTHKIEFAATVRIDCAKRLRLETSNTGYLGNSYSRPTYDTAGEMRPIYENTRQAFELDTVCALANGQGVSAPEAKVYETTELASASHQGLKALKIHQIESAVFVSRAGHLVALNRRTEHCAALTVLYRGRQQPAAVVARDADNDLVVLKVEQASDEAQAIAPAEAPEGRELMLVAHNYDAMLQEGLTQRRTVVVDTAGQRGSGQVDIAAPTGVTTGPLLDAEGRIAGMLDMTGAATREGRTLAKTRGALPIQQLLARTGVDVRGAEARPWPDARRSIALLACYAEQP